MKKYAQWHLARRRRQERRQKEREQNELQDLLSSSHISDDCHGRHQPIILYPSEYDVLLGRGRPFQEWAGNKYLVRCVDDVRDKYTNLSDKFEKTLLTMDVLAKIHDKGGRFIQRVNNSSSSIDDPDVNEGVGMPSKTAEENISQTQKPFSPSSMITSETTTANTTRGWRVVSNDVAREKISHTFRTKKSSSETRQSSTSSSPSSFLGLSSQFFSLNGTDQKDQTAYPPHMTGSDVDGEGRNVVDGGESLFDPAIDNYQGFVKSNGLYKMSDNEQGANQPLKRSKQGNEA